MKKHRHKGFTMSEIIVATLLIAIVGLFFANIVITAINSAYESQSMNEARMVGEAVCSFFDQELIFAADMEVGTNLKNLPNSISMSGESLQNNGEDVFPADYYNNMLVTYETERLNGKTLSVKITVSKKTGPSFMYFAFGKIALRAPVSSGHSSEELFSKTMTVTPANMSLPTSTAEITGTQSGTNLRINYGP